MNKKSGRPTKVFSIEKKTFDRFKHFPHINRIIGLVPRNLINLFI